jgi:hypothetical protein
MERMNGEIRDREQTMGGLKTVDTPILPGMQFYHNFIRGHESLGGATPAEACGLKVEGSDKWKTLIQNASKNEASLKQTITTLFCLTSIVANWDRFSNR